MSDAHQTVLLEEAVTAVMTATDGVYVDGTFGRGGHSRAILRALSPAGRLLVFDKDPQAAAAAENLAAADPRLTFYHDSFATLTHLGEYRGQLTGVLLDLGVSSPQIDDGERGFSFQQDGPLDMRMDSTRGMTAAQWLNTADEQAIATVLKTYGEERFARRIAGAIVTARDATPIERTAQLADIVKAANPSWEKHKHPATRAFQGIRIFINRELDDLEQLLGDITAMMAPGGRLVVISFHSLEDRMVKRFMRDGARGAVLPRGVPVRDEDRGQQWRIVGKAIKASASEVAHNPRARSAVMRVAERLP